MMSGLNSRLETIYYFWYTVHFFWCLMEICKQLFLPQVEARESFVVTGTTAGSAMPVTKVSSKLLCMFPTCFSHVSFLMPRLPEQEEQEQEEEV